MISYFFPNVWIFFEGFSAIFLLQTTSSENLYSSSWVARTKLNFSVVSSVTQVTTRKLAKSSLEENMLCKTRGKVSEEEMEIIKEKNVPRRRGNDVMLGKNGVQRTPVCFVKLKEHRHPSGILPPLSFVLIWSIPYCPAVSTTCPWLMHLAAITNYLVAHYQGTLVNIFK